MSIGLDLLHIALLFKILDDRRPALQPVHAAVLAGVLVHPALVVDDADDGQIVPETELEIVGIVRGGDLHRAGAEAYLDIIVRDDGDDPVRQRQTEHAPHISRHALVLGIDRDRGVAEHGLGTGGRDGERTVAVRKRIAVIPQVGLLLSIFDFRVGERRLAMRAPVDDAVAAIDETFLIVAHESVHHRRREVLVHRERLFGPVAGSAEAFELLDDPAAVLVLPRPRALEEALSADVRLGETLFLLHLLHDLDLRRDGGVVGAGEPERLIAAHALEADDDVLYGLVESVTHVELPRDVGGRHHYGERLFVVVGMSLEIFALEPEVVDPLLERGIVSLFHLVHLNLSFILPFSRFLSSCFRPRRSLRRHMPPSSPLLPREDCCRCP